MNLKCSLSLLLLLGFWISASTAQHTLPLVFEPAKVKQLPVGNETEVIVWAHHNVGTAQVFSEDTFILSVNPPNILFSAFNSTHYVGKFNITGLFLGYGQVYLTSNHSNISLQSPNLQVSVIRQPVLLDKIFVICIATLASLIYINFGCALDWNIVKATIKKPIGPAIGFVSQFGFMPTMSFLLARMLFPDNISMQLGFFFTGCSPGGGASNIYTVALGGNLDLSLAMTTISTFSAFAMIPLWIFTLGQLIFETANFEVPYSKITQVAAGLIIPLLIGTLIQFYLPKISNILVKMMKPFAIFLIIFIILFGTLSNLYMFSLIDWKVIIGGLCIPWFGYMFGALLSCAFQQKFIDVIAIAVETGIQNTGISIYMLRFALEQPAADIAQVCPVAVSLMTPIPLVLLSLYLRFKGRRKSNEAQRLNSTELATPTSN